MVCYTRNKVKFATFSIEEAGKGVGETDEEGEHVHLQYGGVARIHLQDSRQKLQAVGPTYKHTVKR
jgi:hypothetical protein